MHTIAMFFFDRNCCQRFDVFQGKKFIFQQDSAPAHRTRETLELLRQETLDFISPDLCMASGINIYSFTFRYPKKLFWISEIVILDIQNNFFGYLK